MVVYPCRVAIDLPALNDWGFCKEVDQLFVGIGYSCPYGDYSNQACYLCEGNNLPSLNIRCSSFILLLLVFLPLAARADVLVEEGYVRGLPPGQPTTAAFMRLVNKGDAAVTINAAKSDSAERVEFHVHKHQNGMMRMEQVNNVVIPAGGEFVLVPGGYHLMLIGLHKPLREGDDVDIELYTEKLETIQLRLPVRSVLNEHQHR
ncbi:MAG: copper chaperone PCu(A)C [Spongiibacteraceae bacterium]